MFSKKLFLGREDIFSKVAHYISCRSVISYNDNFSSRCFCLAYSHLFAVFPYHLCKMSCKRKYIKLENFGGASVTIYSTDWRYSIKLENGGGGGVIIYSTDWHYNIKLENGGGGGVIIYSTDWRYNIKLENGGGGGVIIYSTDWHYNIKLENFSGSAVII